VRLSAKTLIAAAALVAVARDLGQVGPDNTYGAGRVDALAAWDRF
jgi:hypothetical protein